TAQSSASAPPVWTVTRNRRSRRGASATVERAAGRGSAGWRIHEVPPECINTRVVVPDQRTALAEPRDRYIELGRGEGWNMDFKDALTAGCLGCHRCV